MKFKFLFFFTFILFFFQSCTNSKVEKKSGKDSFSKASITKKDARDSSTATLQQKDSVLKTSNNHSIHNNHSELSNNHTFLLDSYPIDLKHRLSKLGNHKGNGTQGSRGQSGKDGKSTQLPLSDSISLFSHNFINFKLIFTPQTLYTDGEGFIGFKVELDCKGDWNVKEYKSKGTNYTGSYSDLQKTVVYFLRNCNINIIGDKCPETGLIYLNVKSSH